MTMLVLKMVLGTVAPIAASVVLYLLNKKTKFGKFSYAAKQIITGVIFGCVAMLNFVFGSESNYDYEFIYKSFMNVRDAAPLCAGLIFGAPAGIIAGCIGGIARLGVYYFWEMGDSVTGVACAASTVLAGLIAAALRKFVYDNKKPPCSHALIIGVVTESIHMLMILFVNIGTDYTGTGTIQNAFTVVRNIALFMIICNCISVMTSVLSVSLMSKEKIKQNKSKSSKNKSKRIIQTFQKWLLLFIIAAYVGTSLFTFVLDTSLETSNSDTSLWVNLDGVSQSVYDMMKDDMKIIANSILEEVKDEELTDELLAQMSEKYSVSEICYVAPNHIVTASNLEVNKGYNMEDLVYFEEGQTEYISDYSPDFDYSKMKVFCGIALENGGYLQVAYDSDKLNKMLPVYMKYITSYWVINTQGVVVICDEDGNVVVNTKVLNDKNIPEILPEVASAEVATLFTATIENEKYYCTYYEMAGYRVVGLVSAEYALYYREISLYVSSFTLIITFTVLFYLIYIMMKKLVVRNIHKINDNLSEISSGNLNVTVNVRNSREFEQLSDDINQTVDTLKKYIADASARIDKELEVARIIQLSTLPVDFPKDTEKVGYEIYAQTNTAREVGGDFYDYYTIDSERIAIVMADVSGKGISAAMFMMQAKSIIRSLAETETDAAKILTDANRKLCNHNKAEMFVTVWLGILNIKTGDLSFANAGHNAPVIIKNNGTCSFLNGRHGLVLAGMEGTHYRLNVMKLEYGDVICLYTDGITEAETTEHELYGNDRLLNCIDKFKTSSAKDLCTSVKSDVDNFVGDANQFDDMTILALKYHTHSAQKKEVPAEKSELDNVLDFIDSVLEPANVPFAVCTRVKLALEEAFVNIASYAYPNSTGTAEISCGIFGGVIEITLTDSGIPYNPLEKADPDITLSAEERDIGGLGIFMVKKYMDNITYSYTDGKNILTLRKNL